MLDTLDSYFGFFRSTLGMLGSPLNSQQQAQGVANLAVLQAQAWHPDYQQAAYAMIEKFKREAFYRSCSQHWLDAMIDVEIGLNQ